MNSYTVTITPASGAGAEAMIQVAAHDGAARITELVIRPSSDAGVVERLRGIDFDMLVRALEPAIGTRPPAPARPTGVPATAHPRMPATVALPPARARSYRRVPDDLVEVYAAIGSITALAAHYGVPRHTAQGWVNRLRQKAAAS